MYVCKKTFLSVVIYTIIINISIIVFFYSLNLFIQACNYFFYMLMSWFLLVHTCLTYGTVCPIQL